MRRDLALYEVPWPPRRRRRGRPRKYGLRMTRERIEALPVRRSARILYGQLEVVRYRSCRVAARFLKGRVVRAVWVRLERPDQPGEERLLVCTDPDLPATEVITSYAKRWSVEPLFAAMKHGWGLKDAWQQSRQVLMRWVTILAAGYALAQPDAGLHRSGLHLGPRRSGALAAARDAHGRADPGRLGAAFARGRPARAHARARAKIRPAKQPAHRKTGVRRHQSRVNQQSGRHHAGHATAVRCRGQVRLPVNFSSLAEVYREGGLRLSGGMGAAAQQ